MHRGPYEWSDDRTMVTCEKYVAALDRWVPFAALVVGTDDDPEDAALAEDIWNKMQTGAVIVGEAPEPEPEPIEIERGRMRLTPLQFRRGLHRWPLSKPLPTPFGDCNTLREAYTILMSPQTDMVSDELKDEIEYALTIERLNPHVDALATVVGMTPEETDEFFRFSATL